MKGQDFNIEKKYVEQFQHIPTTLGFRNSFRTLALTTPAKRCFAGGQFQDGTMCFLSILSSLPQSRVYTVILHVCPILSATSARHENGGRYTTVTS